jgi:hypothetical protein
MRTFCLAFCLLLIAAANIDALDDKSSVNRLIASAGIKTVTNARTSATQGPFDEQHVLNEIKAEILKRKAARIKEEEGSGLSQPPP